jgi:hypothetical protein
VRAILISGFYFRTADQLFGRQTAAEHIVGRKLNNA